MIMTERKSIEKFERAETKHNEKPGLIEVSFAELWRTAQRRRSTYIGFWITRMFRQSRLPTKSTDDIKVTHPARQATTP